jgi:HSP20 family protein
MDVVRWTPFQEWPFREWPFREWPLDVVDRPFRRLIEEEKLPAANVYETEAEYVVELEAPGYEEKELGVELTDHTLRVTGEHTVVKEEKEKAYHLRERVEKAFDRRFTLPVEADPKQVKADFGKGVLEIRVAKMPELKPTKVKIGKAA